MSALSIQPTFPIFTETDGLPLENGYIWIGTTNLDPQGNPINVYWDAALTIPAGQPIRTINGYPSRNGTPGRLYVNSDYSIRVQNSKGSLVYNAPAATERYNDAVISDVNAQDVVYDPPFIGGVQTNVEAKLAQTVSITDFGAVSGGLAAVNTTAFLAAIAAIQAAGGGAIYVPAGSYLVSKDSLIQDQTDISVTIYGDGPTASQISCADATVGFVLKNNVAGSNISAFTLRDLGINGPGGASPAGIGLHLQGNQAQVRVENVAFNGLNTCMQLEGVFTSFFSGLRFRNYVIGVQGDPTLVGLPAQQNTFTSCYFSFGVNTAPATAYAIKSVNMGQNTYIGCNFEAGGLIKTVDMTGGTGFDTMIGCRFERLNSGTYSWLLLGDNQQIINSTWHVSGTYNTVGTQYALIQAQGFGSSVNEINLSNSNYASNTLLIDSGAKNNYFKFASLLGTDAYDAIFNVVKTLADDDNTVEYPGGGSEKYTSSDLYDTWGGGGVNQYITDSLALSTFTFDGLTNSAGPGGATPEALGPQQDGYTRDLNTPTGNKKTYFTYSATNNYVYIWSIWVLAKTANDTVDLAVGSSLGSPVWRTFTLDSTTKWQRIFMAVRATSTANIYAQLRSNGASGVYAFGPQLEEWLPTSGRFGPSGYVRSSTGISYQMNPAPMQKNQIWGTAIPTVGTYTQGDIIWNLDAASGGAPGWMCTASGTPGTWKAMANLA
jgi:hypothetical protein